MFDVEHSFLTFCGRDVSFKRLVMVERALPTVFASSSWVYPYFF